jgi:hypothetical protein
MTHLNKLGWHWRIRLKGSFWIYRQGRKRCKASTVTPVVGQAIFWHHVFITEDRYGPVHIAFVRHPDSNEFWIVVSSDPTDISTLEEYGLRFDIEQNFLDDKSNGFQLEQTLIRNARALSRLCFVLAITTLYLVSEGVAVVERGQRRLVDPHWFRGHSYLKIGWKWVKRTLSRGEGLLVRLRLPPDPDPEPAMASRKQHAHKARPSFQLETLNFAAIFYL